MTANKILKIINKYSLYIVIAIILISVTWTVAFYFHCNNKERAIQKTLDNMLGKEPQREFYTIVPGPKYFNKTYGFSMTIPNNKYILEEKFSNSAGDNILLIDENFKDNFRNSFLKNDPGINGRNYFAMFIIPKLDESSFNLKENLKELEQMSQKGFVEKTEFLISENKRISFYLTLEKNEKWPTSLDMFLPEATAFFEDTNNIYYFVSSSYFNDSVEERMSHIKIMEEIIKSIKFDN